MIGLIFRRAARHGSPPLYAPRAAASRLPPSASPRTILGDRFGGSVRSLSRPCQSPCQLLVDGSSIQASTAIDSPRTRAARSATFSACAAPPETGILRLSRYFATVRRATIMSALRRRSTMLSSDRFTVGILLVDHLADVLSHRLRRMRLARFGRSDRGGEEVLHLEQTSGGLDELVRGGARHGNSCTPIASPIIFRLSGSAPPRPRPETRPAAGRSRSPH